MPIMIRFEYSSLESFVIARKEHRISHSMDGVIDCFEGS